MLTSIMLVPPVDTEMLTSIMLVPPVDTEMLTSVMLVPPVDTEMLTSIMLVPPVDTEMLTSIMLVPPVDTEMLTSSMLVTAEGGQDISTVFCGGIEYNVFWKFYPAIPLNYQACYSEKYFSVKERLVITQT